MPVRVARQGHPELADIFRTHGHRLGGLTAQQHRVVAALTSCRTAALGGHVRECDRGCGYQEVAYNSCRDRHCPKCQGLARVRWQEARMRDLLPVPYFHLVFTIPACLHEIFLADTRTAYTLLFAAAADTVKQVAANPKNLGAEIGMTALLHTWTQTLHYHPHLHLIVPGGGLDPTGCRWMASHKSFFLPVRILSQVFRGKLLAALEQGIAAGTLQVSDNLRLRVATLLRRASRTSWVVYAKPPFAGPEQVVAYLGRYTHRVAIANERIVAMEDDSVTFHYRDRTDGNRRKSMTLPATAFLRRFLLHVLPPGFVRIRHYGFLANAVRRQRLARCRRLLGVTEESAREARTESWDETLLRVTGKDLTACPQCKQGRLATTHEIPPHPRRCPNQPKEAPT